jgi:acetylornithine deacetylase/succinyl-diaminopimelate desuccinylase-like protein
MIPAAFFNPPECIVKRISWPRLLLNPDENNHLLEFAQNLIRIKSFSGEVEEIIRFIEKNMRSLGHTDVTIDRMGNLVGRIGTGGKLILFDSYVDTVKVNDAN